MPALNLFCCLRTIPKQNGQSRGGLEKQKQSSGFEFEILVYIFRLKNEDHGFMNENAANIPGNKTISAIVPSLNNFGHFTLKKFPVRFNDLIFIQIFVFFFL